ncbi:MAG TPA: hypothetical protein ENH84_04900 [Phycisphaerae bacterium]|nr:hypothetical protein [Phycisphaerae bacterium]
MSKKPEGLENLPACVVEYITVVAKRVGNTLQVRREVFQELTDHFSDALRDCAGEDERQAAGERAIEQFGDAKMLGSLIRRGKKRCRPLWKMAMIRSAQCFLVLIVVFCVYTWWFMAGEPTIRVNYVAKLNQLTQPSVPTEENAWKNYKRVTELYVEPSPEIERLLEQVSMSKFVVEKLADLSPSERIFLEKWIKDNQPAWEEFIVGSRKRYCWVQYSSLQEGDESILTMTIPPLYGLRQMGKQGIWRARIAMEKRQIQRTMEDCLTVVRVGKHWQRPASTLIEQLVGMGISSVGHNEILRIVSSAKITAHELVNTQKQLQRIYIEGYPLMDLGFERLDFLDNVQHCFTEGGLGGGRLIPERLVEGVPFGQIEPEILLGAMFGDGRDKTVAKGLEYYTKIEELVKLSPYEQRTREVNNWSDNYVANLSEIKSPFLKMLLPSFLLAGELAYRSKALHEATLTVLALRRWRLDKGRYPATLDVLVSGGYLKAIPEDPYSDGALKYERRGDDFVLYSVSSDFRDDGGVQVKGRRAPWDTTFGDRVFWPVNPPLLTEEEARRRGDVD